MLSTESSHQSSACSNLPDIVEEVKSSNTFQQWAVPSSKCCEPLI